MNAAKRSLGVSEDQLRLAREQAQTHPDLEVTAVRLLEPREAEGVSELRNCRKSVLHQKAVPFRMHPAPVRSNSGKGKGVYVPGNTVPDSIVNHRPRYVSTSLCAFSLHTFTRARASQRQGPTEGGYHPPSRQDEGPAS